jgi:hypothetical protein
MRIRSWKKSSHQKSNPPVTHVSWVFETHKLDMNNPSHTCTHLILSSETLVGLHSPLKSFNCSSSMVSCCMLPTILSEWRESDSHVTNVQWDWYYIANFICGLRKQTLTFTLQFHKMRSQWIYTTDEERQLSIHSMM